jgi:ABC-2 type transport system permease protein
VNRILSLAQKDLLQNLRDWKAFLFLLIMPVVFTFMFGFAFGAYSGPVNPRLPVAYLDLDNGASSAQLRNMLETSSVIRLENAAGKTPAGLEKQVEDDKLAAAVIVPAGYSQSLVSAEPMRLALVVNSNGSAGASAQREIQAAASRLAGAARTAQAAAGIYQEQAGFADVEARQAFLDGVIAKTLAAWNDPPVRLVASSAPGAESASSGGNAFGHLAPAMTVQFAIAGLIGAAGVIVAERRSRALQRMLTTATSRVQILLGHFTAIFVLIFTQFLILIAFGQLFLRLDYLRQPLAVLLISIASAAFVAALGLMIGTLAKTEEQAISFSLIPMFVLAGLGGAWVPLEVTGKAFQTIGHLSPVAWVMDGFENLLVRGLGFNSVLLPVAVLAGYSVLFFAIAAWKFRSE